MTHPHKIGKYEIQGVLGRGAMGAVYKGFDTAISRAVAVKTIAKSSLHDDELQHLLARFRHEAQAVGRLAHPRIVQIYDYGEDDQHAYIVMELVHGKTLHQHLQQHANYDLREVGEIIRQLLDGLGHAHAAGVVHRDVKPANIMLNSDGQIKISDFGIAHTEASELTQHGDVLGTPHYMAPEQFLGLPIGIPADLYAVGVIAYNLLTGAKPFVGTPALVMQQALNQRATDPSTLNPALSPLIDQVLQRALSKKPEDRYQSAREFAVAFQLAIESSIAQAAPAPAIAPLAAGLLNAAQLIRSNTETLAASRDANATAEAAAGAISLDSSVRKARMLVVDDEERILSALKSMFRARYHVFATTDGNKALEFMKKYHMHVVVSDQRMPIMPGAELLRRAREISPASVRILLTGYSDLASIVGSVNDGQVYRFISKPWNNEELQQTVAEAVTIALELADAKSAPVDLPQKMDAGVLVIDNDQEIFRFTKELVGGRCPVLYANGVESALSAMQAQEIALVVAEVEASREDLTGMLKLMKQVNPQILSIVLTDASDANLVIRLINEAQIFRFLNKPVNVKQLKQHVESALLRYLEFRQTPQLLQQHRVQESAEVSDSSVGKTILASLAQLRGRWFGAGKKP
ncbi:MAG: protein kinase [Burkholderiales bacterium]|nr:protein kinase [Burkholderiales bacterium]